MAELPERFTRVETAPEWAPVDPAEGLRAALAKGEVIKDEPETLLVRAAEGDTACWWKLYRVPPRRRLLGGASRSRALREWRALRAMHDRGVAAAPALCFAEERRGAGLRASLLVTREVGAAQDLRSWLASDGRLAGERESALRAAGRAARALHDAGFVHFRMQLRNLLLGEQPAADGTQPTCWLDTPYACAWRDTPPLALRIVDLVDLAGRESVLDDEDARVVLLAYAGREAPPLPLERLRARRPLSQKLRRIGGYLASIHTGHRPAAVAAT